MSEYFPSFHSENDPTLSVDFADPSLSYPNMSHSDFPVTPMWNGSAETPYSPAPWYDPVPAYPPDLSRQMAPAYQSGPEYQPPEYQPPEYQPAPDHAPGQSYRTAARKAAPPLSPHAGRHARIEVEPTGPGRPVTGRHGRVIPHARRSRDVMANRFTVAVMVNTTALILTAALNLFDTTHPRIPDRPGSTSTANPGGVPAVRPVGTAPNAAQLTPATRPTAPGTLPPAR